MTVLFVHGGDTFARAVYSRERRGYWAQAFPLVLEKYGFVDVESLAVAHVEEILERVAPDHASAPSVVLVGRLPPGAWNEPAIEALRTCGTPVLVEGPVDRSVRDALGLTTRSRSCEDGTLQVTVAEIDGFGRAVTGFSATGPVARSAHRVVPRGRRSDWSVQPEVPLSSEQASAWRAPGWDVERLTAPDGMQVLARWTPWETPENACAAIVRTGDLIICAASLLTFLAQMHTSEPFDGGEYRAARRVAGVESVILGLIDWMHASAGRSRLRVLPWPQPARWARNVRHDFDRPLGADEVDRVLSRHQRAGSAATWYWRSHPRVGRLPDGGEPADLTPVALVARRPGHEVGLHTETLWTGAEAELAAVEEAAGTRIRGTTAHGSAESFRYQGAPNLLWAEAHGLRYTELLQHSHLHPHAFPCLEPDGGLRTASILCLPRHLSFEASASERTVRASAILAAVPLFTRAGGLMQIMNHPDLHGDRLFAMLEAMPAEGRLDLTAAEAIEWWDRSHRADRLSVRLGEDGVPILLAEHDVDDLGVEMLGPRASRSTHRVSLVSGRDTPVPDASVAAPS